MTTSDLTTFEDLQRFAGDTTVPRRAREHVNAEPARKRTASKRGRFYRPELFTSWDRFTDSVLVRVTGWVVLIGGTGMLVTAAFLLRS